MRKTWHRIVGAGIAMAAVGGAALVSASSSHAWHTATASLIDTNGNTAGEVRLLVSGGKMRVTARVQLPGEFAGFHGFHVHAVGVCDPRAANGPFTTAGGHLAEAGTTHRDHWGDLPSLLVNRDGTASMTVRTDRVDLAKLFDADGAAVIVHVGPDNFANIPTRYAPNGPDAATLSTGDAGGRLACGVLR